ncbi:Transcriptional regulator of ribosomal biogenesis proteins [Ascosphaera acerosa]|nr:Transcriptional regulator of ribosomal biogenesis proteins [Ascosphaera acerosa]
MLPGVNGNGGAMSFGLKNGGAGRKDSFSALAGMQWAGNGNGSKPINVAGGSSLRKESLAGSLLAGSLMGGMSFGGISVGSWIKEDIAMSGASPNFHSSSYLPKLEANFMRDFTCCNYVLPTLHDLLQHYEEAHAQKPPPTSQAQSQQRADPHMPNRASSQTPHGMPGAPMSRGMSGTTGLLSPRPRELQPTTRLGASGVDEDMDMEMDDPLTDSAHIGAPANMSRFGQPQQQQFQQTQQQAQQQANLGLTPLSLSMLHGGAGAAGGQGATNYQHNFQQHLRSQSGTPGIGQTPTRNNPTVSSVNTPMLVSQSSSQFRGTPDSSTPGTPGAEADVGLLGATDVASTLQEGANASQAYTGFNLQNLGDAGGGINQFGLQNVTGTDDVNLCIDEPAKRLFSPAQFNSTTAAAMGGMASQHAADLQLQQAQLQQQNQGQNLAGMQAAATPSLASTGSSQSGMTVTTAAPTGATTVAPANKGTNVLFRLGTSQYGPNSEIAQRIREQQLLAGVPDTTLGLLNEEPKPFRCPVIGCEKAYKNQNGLKYHKAHGHNNQQLHDNADGTFSIVNPETCAPYPGTLGMEKEKPFRCEVCGKRYKNLNGLKYHRSHSPPCNPDLQQLVAATAAANGVGVGVGVGGGAGLSLAGGVMRGQNINVAGAGLPGIGEEVLRG